MLNPLEVAYQSGATLYFIIHNRNGTVWNNDTVMFESYNPSNWVSYSLSLVEQSGSGYYRASLPSGIGDALVTECTYNQQGNTPNISDASAGPIGIGQSQGVDIAAVVHNEDAASNMQVNLLQLVQGLAVSGALSTTQIPTDLSSSANNLYVGRLIIFTSGALMQEVSTITAYNGVSKVLSFNALTSVPSTGDAFLIV